MTEYYVREFKEDAQRGERIFWIECKVAPNRNEHAELYREVTEWCKSNIRPFLYFFKGYKTRKLSTAIRVRMRDDVVASEFEYQWTEWCANKGVWYEVDS